ncbi:Arginine decarboxylase [bioreactor metagenome]|uniref:Arginine decarboxylase n=1 Tax=bioreactor metagenome TaxID=1076179 RepID=A0A645IRI5_9ZZZZ
MLEIERLISALAEIKRLYSKSPVGMLKQEYMEPFVKMPPQKAFYGPKETVDILNAQHRISAEFVMSYPPGIPILAPGELITPEILQYIHYAKEKGCLLTGPQSLDLQTLEVIMEGV